MIKRNKPRLISQVVGVTTLVLVSLFFVFPRIVNHPDPRSSERFEHHKGDGATEVIALDMHDHWLSVGYLATYFVGCSSSPTSTSRLKEASCYTHYPTYLTLVSSLLLHITDGNISDPNSLRAARFFIYAMNIGIMSWALCVFILSFELGILSSFIMAAYLGSVPGFYIYLDHFFGWGSSLPVGALMIGMALKPLLEGWDDLPQWWIRRLTLLHAVSLLINFEIAMYPWLLMAAIASQQFLVKKRIDRSVIKLFKALTLVAITVMGLRLIQNALVSGGITNALKDLIHIVAYRSLDIGVETHVSQISWGVRTIAYFRSLGGSIRFHARTVGVLIFLCALVLGALFNKSRKDTVLLAVLAFIVTSWNFTMIQHTSAHVFVSRYSVLVAILAIGFISKQLGVKNFYGIPKSLFR